MDRRHFFGTTASLITAFQASSLVKAQNAIASAGGRPADSIARDEDFWFNIRHAFTVDRNMINLNNGGVSPAPKIVMDTEVRYLEIENLSPSYYMWNVLDPGVETVRRRLARMFGVDTEEIAITRNASEANEIVQLGMKLNPGDEVITTNQDYPRMITTWQQRERREGIKLKQLTFPRAAAQHGLSAEDIRRRHHAADQGDPHLPYHEPHRPDLSREAHLPDGARPRN